MRVGVVGAGPAGFYTVQSLLRHAELQHRLRRIDVFESLPVPFGLVRYGVAPDHPEVKRVTNSWTQLMDRYRAIVRFYGNVHVNGRLSLELLKKRYADGVQGAGLFLCMGAQGGDRKLGIPGETPCIESARAFVAWYNGHPDYADRVFLSQRDGCVAGGGEAVIIGNGNVALDVARMLLQAPARLHVTDCNPVAVDALAAFGAQTLHIIGRRDASNASWTARELRELMTLAPDLKVIVHEAMRWAPTPPGLQPAQPSRTQRRALEVLRRYAGSAVIDEVGTRAQVTPRTIHFWFGLSPVRALLGDDQRVHLICAPNELFYDSLGQVQCRTIQDAEPVRITASAGAVFRSIGYVVSAPRGLPLDSNQNCIRNNAGRVVGLEDAVYVAGWLKHGPRGVIANTLVDAQETVAQFVSDLRQAERATQARADGSRTHEPEVEDLLKQAGHSFVDWDGWLRIDAEEQHRGRLCGADRRKILTRSDMLRLAGGASVADYQQNSGEGLGNRSHRTPADVAF
jgi:NADPH-dependent glutamate synthase beta subunit-like oxidoreductase